MVEIQDVEMKEVEPVATGANAATTSKDADTLTFDGLFQIRSFEF